MGIFFYFLPPLNMTSHESASQSPIDDLIAFESGELSEDQAIELFQRLIDDGSVWKLQGSYGRTAMELIQAGRCTLGPIGHRDFYGNYVPSRDEVQPGIPGSPEFVSTSTSCSPTDHEA